MFDFAKFSGVQCLGSLCTRDGGCTIVGGQVGGQDDLASLAVREREVTRHTDSMYTIWAQQPRWCCRVE